MKIDKSLFLILLFFLLLSVALSWQSMLEGGNFVYRDATTITNMQAFRDDFFSLYKSYNMIDFDFYKRIPESWIFLFTDMEAFDRIKFTLLPLATLAISFFVGERILEENGTRGKAARLIAAAFALIYLFNPLTLQIFLKYYPMINMALFPLFFYFSYSSLSKLSMKRAIAAGLIAAFMFMMVVHTLLYILITVPIAALVAMRGRNPVKLLPALVVMALVFLFLTAFFTSPYLVTTSVKGNYGFHALSSQMLNSFSDPALFPAPMLMDYASFWWPWVSYSYPAGGAFFILAFIFVGVLFVFGLSQRNPWSLMAVLGLAVSFFLSKGAGPPFGEIYEILNFNLPVIGWLMRVPNKFLHLVPFFTALIYLRFCAVAHQEKRKGMMAFAVISVPLLLFLSWPYLTGDIGGNIKKTDYTVMANDLEKINDMLGGDASVVAWGVHKSGTKDIYGNVFSLRTFLHREMKFYDQHSNFSGLSEFGPLGVQYVVGGGADNREKISKSFESVFDGDFYSLYKISNRSSDVTVPEHAYASYASYEAARSMMRDPLENHSMGLVLFPMAFLDYSEEAVEAADVILLDSVPVLSQTYDSERAFGFYSAAKASSARNGWAKLTTESVDDRTKSPFRTWDHHFESGLSSTYKEPTRTSGKEYSLVLDAPSFEKIDLLSSINGSAVSVRGGKQIYSSVRMPLGLRAGSQYRIQFVVDSEDEVKSEIFLQDSSGDIIKSLALRQVNSMVSTEFSVPAETVRASLLLTVLANKTRKITYSVEDFEIHEISYRSIGPVIHKPFKVQNTSEYDLYVRLYKGPYAESMRFYIDGNEVSTVATQHNISHFYWEKIYSGEISAGEHKLSAEQLGGYNSLNIAYLLPKGSPLPDWGGKTIIYRLTGLGDFGNINYQIANDSKSSTFYLANSTMPLLSPFEVVSAGNYSITSSVRGAHKILVDGIEAPGSLYLGEGPHAVQVVPLNGSVAVDHVTLVREGKGLNKVTGYAYEKKGQSQYIASANSTGPFFISLNRGYSPLWVAETGDGTYRPFASYFSINGFLINGSGETRMEIDFEPQRYSNLWAVLGGLGILAISLAVWRYEK